MSNISWVGKSGDWSDANKWRPIAPVSGDNIYINNNIDSYTYTVSFDISSCLKYANIKIGSILSTGSYKLLIGVNSETNNPYIFNAEVVTLYHGSVILSGGVLNVASGLTIGATAAYSAASVTGYGTLTVSPGDINGYGSLVASGGTLDVTGGVSSSIRVVIDSSQASVLKLESTSTIGSSAGAPFVMDNSHQTLEIGARATVKFGSATAQKISGGTILIDGGILKSAAGINLGSGASLSGYGVVAAWGKGFTGGGTVTASGGNLSFTYAVDQSGDATKFIIGQGQVLTFKGAVGTANIDPTIAFSGFQASLGQLSLSGAPYGSFHGTIEAFSAGDEITVGGSSTANTLSVSGSYVIVKYGYNIVQKIDFGSPTIAADVKFASENNKTTLVICFMAGTMIRTLDGEIAVETLQRGDLVWTTDGVAKPVSWLGRQTISTRFADPLRTWPIRIKAGALAENVPGRDLLLSPDHAVLVDGALIHAGALVNDSSIVREASVPEIFTYYHVEIDDHSLILAENTPAETFVDNVDRLAFDNWSEHVALYPEGKPIAELPYPRAKGRRQVPVYVRVQLAERAEIIGASTAAAMAA